MPTATATGGTTVDISGAVSALLERYDTVLKEYRRQMTGDPGRLRSMAVSCHGAADRAAGVSSEMHRQRRDLGSNWQGSAYDAFAVAVGRVTEVLDGTEHRARRHGAALENAAGALETAAYGANSVITDFQISGMMLMSQAKAVDVSQVNAVLNAARETGEKAVTQMRRHYDMLGSKLDQVTAELGGSALPTGPDTAPANPTVDLPAPPPGQPAPEEPAWDPVYHSPNPHPAVVGSTRVGGKSVPTYDMTGHLPPAQRPAGTLNDWITEAKSVLAANGVDTSSMSDADLRALIRHESAGDPHALNNWDRNARNGIPSKGLMQTIDPTFNAHSVPGHRDVWNPVDNIVAGVRYGLSRYGDFANIPGIRALHQGGGYVGY